jgi:hypothetical protein
MKLFAVLASLVIGSMAVSLDSQLYEDLLMEDFYRRLAMLDDEAYYPQMNEMNEVPIDTPEASLSQGISLDSRGDGEAMIRDSEYIEHSSNAGSRGFIHMSGNAHTNYFSACSWHEIKREFLHWLLPYSSCKHFVPQAVPEKECST